MSKKNKGKTDGTMEMTLATKNSIKEFNEKFPIGTEVVVTFATDETKKEYGVINGTAIVADDMSLQVDIQFKDDEMTLICPVEKVRARRIEVKRTSQKLRVAITNAEKLESGAAIADLQQRGGCLTADMKAEVKRMKIDIDSVTAQMLSHGERLRTGYDLRAVDCELILDFDKGVATEIRKDNGEVINTRPLYPSEIEQPLPLQFDSRGNEVDPGSGSGPQMQEPGGKVLKEPITQDEIDLALEVIRETQRATTSTIQRRLRISYTRAADLMDKLEEKGIVGPPNGDEPRDVLIPLDNEPTE